MMNKGFDILVCCLSNAKESSIYYNKKLSNIFPNFNRNIIMNLMNKLKDIV